MKENKNNFVYKSNIKEKKINLGNIVLTFIVVAIIFLISIGISFSKYRKNIDVGTIDVTVDTAIELVYSLSSTEPIMYEETINIIPRHKDNKTYEEYGIKILEELSNNIEDEDALLQEKEKLLLEGLNYWDVEENKWTGTGFSSLNDFVEHINETDGSEFEDIYELMRNWNGNLETDTNEEVLEDFLLYYGEMYIKPEKYINTYLMFKITKPDGTVIESEGNIEIPYIVEKNGEYIFKAENGLGDTCSLTVEVNNIIYGDFSRIYAETTLYEDINEDTVWVPKGFAVGLAEDINEVEEGIVITDAVDENGSSVGNEFVWIPVNLTGTDEEKSLAFEQIRTTYSDSNYSEPYTSGYSAEEDEYSQMKASILKYGGFYIGRYEAGTSTQRYGESNGTSDMVVKKGIYPYSYVSWGDSMSDYESNVTDLGGLSQGKGAVYLSKNMYTDSETYDVRSTLCYGVQWDAALEFIEDSTHSISDSLSWGNYANSIFTFTGKYTSTPQSSTAWTSATNIEKTAGTKWTVTTGASEQNKAKNIYDLAGNVAEWTMEAYNDDCRVRRGGHRGCDDEKAYASLRENL